MKKIIIIFLFAISPNLFFTQTDSPNFLNIYYGLGIANPAGSVSKHSQTYNNFGKLNAGLNMKGGIEYFINSKNAVSIDFDYGIFSNSKNDSLLNMVKRKVDSYAIPYIEASDDKIDVYIATVCLGYSYLFNFKKFSVQPKLNIGRASFAYDYIASYLLTNSLTFPPTNSITASSVTYSFNDYYYYTAKPEVILKFPLKKKENFDLVLGLSVAYFYARPNMTLYETKDSKTSEVLVLKDNVNSVNINFSLNFIIKKSLLSGLFS